MSTAAGTQEGGSGQAPLGDVLARPDEDQPRLGYAAWCERQVLSPVTVARGKFIRAEVGLVAKGASATWDERFTLRSMASNAKREHGAAWDATLRSMVGSVEYDRGFVELVRVSASVWRDQGGSIRQMAPVRHLDLVGAGALEPAFLGSDALAGIRSLLMDRDELTDAHVAALASSPHVGDLRWLSIAHNELTDKSGVALAASKEIARLVYADFAGNPNDPTNQFSHDGVVVGSIWLPREGERLEATHGRLAWLRWAGQTFETLVPDRFRV